MRNLIQEKTISFRESALPLSSGMGNRDNGNADSGKEIDGKTKGKFPSEHANHVVRNGITNHTS